MDNISLKTRWLTNTTTDKKLQLCRLAGAVSVGLGVFFIAAETRNEIMNLFKNIAAGYCLVDGAVDIITGKHHIAPRLVIYFVLSKINRVLGKHSKYP